MIRTSFFSILTGLVLATIVHILKYDLLEPLQQYNVVPITY